MHISKIDIMIIEPNYREMYEQRQNTPSRLIKHLRPRAMLCTIISQPRIVNYFTKYIWERGIGMPQLNGKLTVANSLSDSIDIGYQYTYRS